MTIANPLLFAIGGGGATYGTDPELERALLAMVNPAPRVGYLGVASRDDPKRIAHMHALFAALGGQVTHLPMDQSLAAFAADIATQDILYVGGGNTPGLVAHLRESGKGEAAIAAARRGLVLAGVSAGAVCWFEWGLFDRYGNGLEPLPALGALPGSLCPHFDSDLDRRANFPQMIAQGRLPPGYGIDDGAALVFSGGRIISIVSVRPGAWAYRLAADGSVCPVSSR